MSVRRRDRDLHRPRTPVQASSVNFQPPPSVLILFKSASLSTRGAEDSIRFSARMSSSDKPASSAISRPCSSSLISLWLDSPDLAQPFGATDVYQDVE